MAIEARAARPFDLIVFDLDGTLIDFSPARRLDFLAELTGFPRERIHAAIWGSDFERAAEQGAYDTGEAYLAGFNERLGFKLTLDLARRAGLAAIHFQSVDQLRASLRSLGCLP